MKYYVDVKHIAENSTKSFEKQIKKTVSLFQSAGYEVEIQNGFSGAVFSAIVSAYVNKQKGDIISDNLEG